MNQKDLFFTCAASLLGFKLAAGSRATTARSSSATRWNCEWDVHYNTWIPSFRPGEYRHNGPSGGAHCLDACCQDPTCTGIQLESSEQFQCYEYDSPPDGLNDVTSGRRLGDGSWLVHQRPAWSVFMKASRKETKEAVDLQPPPLPSASRGTSNGNGRRLTSESHEASKAKQLEKQLDEKLSTVSAMMGLSQQHCQWVVHYDQWIPTFVPGEYEHNDEAGRAHCIEACCQDPSCAGIQLESSEMSQCYKYTNPPAGLIASEGQALGDGNWLRQKPQAWSILVKTATVPSWRAQVPQVPALPQFAAGSPKAHTSEFPNKHCDWTVHYDMWIPTFAPGEYEHNDADGGAHCLQACCEDPTCVGLALESSEKFQCYRYARPPVGLANSHARRLGDGKWLRSQRQAWSIFLKVDGHTTQHKHRLGGKAPVRVQKLRQPVKQPEGNQVALRVNHSLNVASASAFQVASAALKTAYCSSFFLQISLMLALHTQLL